MIMILDAILLISGMLLGIAVSFALAAWAINRFIGDDDE